MEKFLTNETSKPFGYSYLVDLYNCDIGLCDNLELHYRLLEELVSKLKIKSMSAPIVVHIPTELYPNNIGVSAWIPLVSSGIQAHSIESTRFTTWDIYSCNTFEMNIVKQILMQGFKTTDIQDYFVIRGTKYGMQTEIYRGNSINV